MNVVISQSMYFPWVGMLEQLRIADVFVRYDDVQFSKGSFTNRVQIKTTAGSRWMTIPLTHSRLGQPINGIQTATNVSWREHHLTKLRDAYQGAEFFQEMLSLAAQVLQGPAQSLSEVAYDSIIGLADYFGLTKNLQLLNIEDLSIAGTGSQRVLDVVRAVGGTRYITGHGARNYLDHEAFESAGIEVQYIQYKYLPYQQLHGPFTPYVSALDLVACCGRAGEKIVRSQTVNWRDFLHES